MQPIKFNTSHLTFLATFLFLFLLALLAKVEHPILLVTYVLLYFAFLSIVAKIIIKISTTLAALISANINVQIQLVIVCCSALSVITILFLHSVDTVISFDNFTSLFIK